MTTNIERVVRILMGEGMFDAEAHCYAQALADAGLLMPGLPKPEWSHDDPKWQSSYRKAFKDKFGSDLPVPSLWTGTGADTTLQVFPGEGQVCPYFLGEPENPVSAEMARQIGLKWLAAAKLAKENKNE